MGRPPAFGRHGITLVDRRGTASNERARDELGWEPGIGLDEGIERSAEWLRGLSAVSA
jgi:nucleoside-diphosphate-sugar epimerase